MGWMDALGKTVMRAECGCGWKGPKRTDEEKMRKDVEKHRC